MTFPRAIRITLRGMPTPLRAIYFGVAGFAVVMMLVALWAGLLLAVPLVALFLGSFLYTAPFIFARRWRPEPERPARRPVVRRRRA